MMESAIVQQHQVMLLALAEASALQTYFRLLERACDDTAIPYTYEYRGSGDKKEGKQCKVTEKTHVCCYRRRVPVVATDSMGLLNKPTKILYFLAYINAKKAPQ